MTNKKLDVIVDLQFGSTGKGLIAGYLAKRGGYDVVISANRPNAGHTYIDRKGNKMVHKVLPNGCVGPNVRTVLIGPGSVFSVEQLQKEMDTLSDFGYAHFRVLIHEAAVMLTEEHKNAEEGYNERIGSTQQGAAVAIINKMERNVDNSPLAGHHKIDRDLARVISSAEYAQEIYEAKEILLEGAQGYSLGIDAGFWPFCTSRNCTVNQFMADSAVPHAFLRKVIGTARTYPIRVAGNSGPCYPDQEELSWKELGQEEERTTVTQRVRRVFTYSHKQMSEAIRANCPDEIFINFCNYLENEIEVRHIINEINEVSHETTGKNVTVRYLGYGAEHGDVEDLNGEVGVVRKAK